MSKAANAACCFCRDSEPAGRAVKRFGLGRLRYTVLTWVRSNSDNLLLKGLEENQHYFSCKGNKMAAKAPTVKEIVEDKLTQLSLEYWATGASAKKKPYDAKVNS